MNPPCAKCKKTVYPMEKLNCLDKVWHKSCFRCESCNLLLSMKTYKGHNKLPYCNTHYPTTRFTAVADTPENKRLAQQSRNQSDLVYRKDREESMKGFTPVADSVGQRQAQMSGQLASQIGYQTAPHEVEGIRSSPAHAPPPQQAPYQPPPPQMHQAPPPQMHQAPPPQQQPARPSKPKWMALYDYSATDDDEVSFNEGDAVEEVTVIDDGWVEGRIVRTGQYGMIPSNYIDKK